MTTLLVLMFLLGGAAGVWFLMGSREHSPVRPNRVAEAGAAIAICVILVAGILIWEHRFSPWLFGQ